MSATTVEATGDVEASAPVILLDQPLSRVVLGAPPAIEFGSPFAPSLEESVQLRELLETQPRSLLRELLSDPKALAERLLDGRAATTMVDMALTLVGSAAVAGAALGAATNGSTVRALALLPFALILAVIAALGPVAASAVMVGARLPWRLLAGALTMATARGAMVLCASAPLSVLGMRADAEWLGPLTIVFSFGLAGVSSGRLMRKLMDQAALVTWERTGAELGPERMERVALVGRVGLVQLAFTLTIAVWSFRILG
jgi:hypothetical protein